jgi:Ca2+/Na+ antiporter
MAGFAIALWGFSASGHRITRIEGLIMMAAYAAYVWWLVARV